MYECRYCGRECKSEAGLSIHEKVCARRPSRSELRQFALENSSLEAVAKACGASWQVVRRWLVEDGLWPLSEVEDVPDAGLDALAELAPWSGRNCWQCRGWRERMCWLRQAMGLWPLCEAPERLEAEYNGWLVWVWAWMWVRMALPRPLPAGGELPSCALIGSD